MKKVYLFALTIALGISAHAQHLLTYQLLQDYSMTDVTNYLDGQGVPTIFVPVTNGMKIYKITYSTVSYDSSQTIASGTVFLPSDMTCKVPVLSYNHGTTLKKSDAPSNQTGEYVIGVAVGADGYIVSMPDYLGLGDSPGLHPYHHAHSEATCSIDMLRATYDLMDTLNYQHYNDEVYITGYSQGGHTAMSMSKFIQEHLSSELHISATAPLSGAYDLSGVQAEVITRDSSYGAPGYLPFILFAYQMVYNIYPSYSDFLKSPYDTLFPPLMDGSVGLGSVEALMSDTPNTILLPSILQEFETNPNFIFRQLLEQNSLIHWVPNKPMKMFFCEADELVSYHNSEVARDTMNSLGATLVQIESAGSTYHHQDCALFALLRMKGFFDTYRRDRYDINLVLTSTSSPGSTDGSLVPVVTGGYAPYSFAWSNSTTDSAATNLAPGTYSVTVTDANGCTSTAGATVGIVGVEELFEELGIEMYPNPTTDVAVLKFSKPFENELTIRVMDLTGRSVLTWNFAGGTTSANLDVSSLSSGVYGVEVRSGSLRLARKLIVE